MRKNKYNDKGVKSMKVLVNGKKVKVKNGDILYNKYWGCFSKVKEVNLKDSFDDKIKTLEVFDFFDENYTYFLNENGAGRCTPNNIIRLATEKEKHLLSLPTVDFLELKAPIKIRNKKGFIIERKRGLSVVDFHKEVKTFGKIEYVENRKKFFVRYGGEFIHPGTWDGEVICGDKRKETFYLHYTDCIIQKYEFFNEKTGEWEYFFKAMK